MKIKIEQEIPDERIFELLNCAMDGASSWAWIHLGKSVEPTDEKLKRYLEYWPLSTDGCLFVCDKEETTAEFDNRFGDRLFWFGRSLSEQEEDGIAPEDLLKGYVLDRVAIENGLQVMAKDYPKDFAEFLAENEDSNTGDCFLQCCLFGKSIYG